MPRTFRTLTLARNEAETQTTTAYARRPSYCVAIAVVIFSMSTSAHASPASRQRTREAFTHAYGLNFAEAYQAFAHAASLDATDPAPVRGIAAVAWIETLFIQGVATFEAFSGQVSSKADVVRPPVPADLTQRFQSNLDRARALAHSRLNAAPDADAHYQVGATEALSALYMASVQGRTFGSLSAARRAVKALERARALDPTKREPALVLGMSRYTVSTMSAPVRLLANIAGLSGGRAEGIALLEEAASSGSDTEADALFVLMIVYNREGRYRDATDRLARLRSQFPSNRLIALNEGATAIEGGRFELAETRLGEGLRAYYVRREPLIWGEEALWYLKVGTARAALGLSDQAEADLSKVLTLAPREWVRGRAHFELAKIALARGDGGGARRQFNDAARFAARSSDHVTERHVKVFVARLGKER